MLGFNEHLHIGPYPLFALAHWIMPCKVEKWGAAKAYTHKHMFKYCCKEARINGLDPLNLEAFENDYFSTGQKEQN